MKCILCHVNEAAVPDRERMGRPIKRVCRECHADRLREDWIAILARRRKGETNPIQT
jgi:hypothetical protein